MTMENSLFTDDERNRLLEAIPGGAPRSIDLMGQAKSQEFTGATIGRRPNAFVVFAVRPDGSRHEVASYYFQTDKPRAARHARWNAIITMKSLKQTLGLMESSNRIPRKGPKYRFIVLGDAAGHWEVVESFPFGQMHGKWYATASLNSKNDWRTLAVENATEHHQGFLKALREMVKAYPELIDWIVQFDGPYMPVSKLVGGGETKAFDWSKVTFYHGTSWYAWSEFIKQHGLKPRGETQVGPAYGTGVHAAEGRTDAVYLTTQLGMAESAAREASNNAAKAGHPSGQVILKISGIRGTHVEPDEDSRETDPVKSLEKMGSIAYTATIPPSLIRVHKTKFPHLKAGWVQPGKLTSLAPEAHFGEATYEVDAKARAEANKVWDEVVDYVRKALESGEELPTHNQTGGFYLPRRARLPHDVMVVLAPQGVQTGYGRGRKSGAHAIVMGDVLLGPNDTTYLDTRVNSARVRREFVHEYVHLLDTLRTKSHTSTGRAMRSARAGKLAGYFNTPAEYNAWSQDFAHAVEQDIEGAIRVAQKISGMRPALGEKQWEKLRQSVATVSAFEDRVSKLDDERRIEAMKGTKWERKWNKRLANLYRAMKRRVQEAA